MSTNFKPIGGLGEMATPSGKVKKPRAKKTNELTLDELYGKAAEVGKMMPSVRKQIIAKEDFSRVQERYCNSACGLCPSSRRPKQVQLTTRPVDIVILQDHNAL